MRECPFCGSASAHLGQTDAGLWFVQCAGGCGGPRTRWRRHAEQATADWDARAVLPVQSGHRGVDWLDVCPWCGDSDIAVHTARHAGTSAVFCAGCGAWGPLGWSTDDARERWNARYMPQNCAEHGQCTTETRNVTDGSVVQHSGADERNVYGTQAGGSCAGMAGLGDSGSGGVRGRVRNGRDTSEALNGRACDLGGDGGRAGDGAAGEGCVMGQRIFAVALAWFAVLNGLLAGFAVSKMALSLALLVLVVDYVFTGLVMGLLAMAVWRMADE